MLPNDVKLRIHVIYQLDIDFIMAKKINFLSSKHNKNLLPSFLKLFSMFKIKCWYSLGGFEKSTAEKITRRCINCGKELNIDVDNLNTTYQDIITTFVLNKILYHVGMLWIIEIHEKLQYDMEKHNSEWMTGCP